MSLYLICVLTKWNFRKGAEIYIHFDANLCIISLPADESVPSKRRRLSQEHSSDKGDSSSAKTGLKRTSEKDSEAKETDSCSKKRPAAKPEKLSKKRIAEELGNRSDGDGSDDAKVPASPDSHNSISTPPPLLSPRSPTEMPGPSTAAASPSTSGTQVPPSGVKGPRLGPQKYRKQDCVTAFIKSLELLIGRLEKT